MIITAQHKLQFGATHQPAMEKRLPTYVLKALPNPKKSAAPWLKIQRGNRGINLPSPYFLSQFLPPPHFFEPISPSFLNSYVSFSPSSLLFPPISPSSQLFLGHFSLLPILFLSPLKKHAVDCMVWATERAKDCQATARPMKMMKTTNAVKMKKEF